LYAKSYSAYTDFDIQYTNRRAFTQGSAFWGLERSIFTCLPSNPQCPFWVHIMESLQGGSNYNTPPDKMQFLDNRARLLYPNFLVYMGEILLQLIFFKNYCSFLQTYGYINILWHIFNSARNNQQQLVIFIHVMHGFCGRLFRWEGKIAFNSKQDQSKS